MNKIFVIMFLIAISGLIVAHGNTDPIEEGKILVQSQANCANLGNEELEDIGEYLMKQMHPGESHEFMDRMMGFEESDPGEAQFHINLAKTIYCENNGTSGIMGLRNMMNSGAFAGGMMGGTGMMGSYGLFGGEVFNLLIIALLAGVVGLVYLHIWNTWKNRKVKR